MIDNVAPRKVWEALTNEATAAMVDVRTDAEWNFVGLADLTDAGKQPVLIPWQVYPAMQVNAGFVAQMKQAGITAEHHVYFLCRSGVRSLARRPSGQAAGFPQPYNIADGFEGPPDSDGHRGQVAGWKAEGLPWRQR